MISTEGTVVICVHIAAFMSEKNFLISFFFSLALTEVDNICRGKVDN